MSGRNPMRYDCQGGKKCFNKYMRPKIEEFYDCFSNGINFGDVDGMVERNGHGLFIEWKSNNIKLPKGQEMSHLKLSKHNHLVFYTIYGNAETMEVIGFRKIADGKKFKIKDFSYKDSGFDMLKNEFRRWYKFANENPL